MAGKACLEAKCPRGLKRNDFPKHGAKVFKCESGTQNGGSREP